MARASFSYVPTATGLVCADITGISIVQKWCCLSLPLGHVFPDAGGGRVFTASSGCFGSVCVLIPFHGVDWVPDQG